MIVDAISLNFYKQLKLSKTYRLKVFGESFPKFVLEFLLIHLELRAYKYHYSINLHLYFLIWYANVVLKTIIGLTIKCCFGVAGVITSASSLITVAVTVSLLSCDDHHSSK